MGAVDALPESVASLNMAWDGFSGTGGSSLLFLYF
jgi:hypothetical protein